MILLLDNYDSFVHNVAHALRALGHTVEVVRNDAVSVEEALAGDPTHLILSPGPGVPDEAGISVPLVRAGRGRIPLLGICLGHQAIGSAYGAAVIPARTPAHGRASRVVHTGEGIFAGLPSPFDAGLYHSLAVDEASLPAALRPIAWTREGELMGIAEPSAGVWGVQFHPESILTPVGTRILAAFAALPAPAPLPRTASPRTTNHPATVDT
jgi:anthranilate synthase/aminodeoxychorismate synthase-like glutamine amidotransferase